MRGDNLRWICQAALAGALAVAGASCGGGGSTTPPPRGERKLEAGTGAACDILMQNCPTGQKCYPGLSSTGKAITQCITAGTAAVGASCTPTASSDGCVKGAICLQVTSTTSQCFALCGKVLDAMGTPGQYSNALCNNPTTYCTSEVVASLPTDGGAPTQVPLALICAPGCDIYGSPKTCTDSTGAAGACYVAFGGPVCASVGTGATGSTCANVNSCVPGDSCLPTSSTTVACEQTCDTTQPQPAGCPSGQTCMGASDPDLAKLGLCK